MFFEHTTESGHHIRMGTPSLVYRAATRWDDNEVIALVFGIGGRFRRRSGWQEDYRDIANDHGAEHSHGGFGRKIGSPLLWTSLELHLVAPNTPPWTPARAEALLNAIIPTIVGRPTPAEEAILREVGELEDLLRRPGARNRAELLNAFQNIRDNPPEDWLEPYKVLDRYLPGRYKAVMGPIRQLHETALAQQKARAATAAPRPQRRSPMGDNNARRSRT